MDRETWRLPAQWWWLDAPLAGAVVTAAALLVEPGTGIDVLGQLPLSERRGIYTDLLQLATIFAGFGGVIFAIYLGLQSRRVKELRNRLGKNLLHIWLAAILTPWLCAFGLVLAKALDRGGEGSGNFARWGAFGAVLVVLFQLVRIVWIFYQLTMIEMADHEPTARTADRPIKIKRRAS